MQTAMNVACPVARPAAPAAARRAAVTPLRASAFRGQAVAFTPAQRKVSAKGARVVCQAAHAAPAKPSTSEELLNRSINAIRFLAIDGVEKANSGHPGLPMGCAPMAYVIWRETMKFNPKNTQWVNRDRFVLSAGHGSMLQYAMLHLTGFDSVPAAELAQFRQWGSRTPGHPENFLTPGVEVTTGPLGQGIANAVGLAVAEKHLAARFNKPDVKLIDHYTYCILGDGCNMEGISQEAISLAGHWGLGKLIALYDDNHISIDGHTDISFTEDVCARYAASGWHVQHVVNGNTDIQGIRDAIARAKAVTDKPSLIKVTTIIGYGSPNKADSHDVHGAALGKAEVEATRQNLKWPYAPFEVPEDVKTHMGECIANGAAAEAAWKQTLETYKSKYPKEAAEFVQLTSGKLPDGWEKALPTYKPEDKGVASRIHSQACLNALAPVLPGLIGGSADLAPSNMTLMKMFGDFQKDTPAERNVRFGVREHGMGAIVNGMALHNSGLIPYCATFFIFTDYMRGAMRVSALSEIGIIFVMTHDSIGLGEDGPTHQPIEHLSSFRAMPNLLTMRPGDGNESSGMYKVAILNRKRPSVLAMSRQALPNLPGTSIEGSAKGAYVVHGVPVGTNPEVIIIGTGSELSMAVDAAKELEKEGKKVRVVSMPCWELFEEQTQEYRDSILPPAVKARVSVEAGSTFGWSKWVGDHGKSIGIDTFGASAPANILYEKFGITQKAVVEAAHHVMKHAK